MPKLEIEGEVVDSGADVVDLLRWDAGVHGEVARRALHGVAQADSANRALSRDGPAGHRHWVHVLQEVCVRAELLHVTAEIDHDRDRPEPAHDAADPDRVADRLAQPEALRDLEVGHGRGPVAADLHHRDDVIGAVQCRSSFLRAFDPRAGAGCFDDPPCYDDRVVETLLVHVHQSDGRALSKLRVGQQVADQGLRKDRRAGADEGDLHRAARRRLARSTRLRIA